MHEPLEGIADADALLGRPFPLPAAPLPLARWVDVVQVAEHGAEVAWNLDDTRAGAPGRLALYAGLEARARARPAGRGRRARRGRDRRAHGARCPRRSLAAARHRAALAARRPAPAAHGAGAVGARRPARPGAFGVGSRAHWAGACIATSSWGWPGGALLAVSVFLPWYGTDPDNRFAQIDGARGDQSVLGGAPDPALAAAGRLGGAVHPRLHHRHRRQALLGARRDDDGRRRSPPSG